jgi:hypothetical protein
VPGAGERDRERWLALPRFVVELIPLSPPLAGHYRSKADPYTFRKLGTVMLHETNFESCTL